MPAIATFFFRKAATTNSQWSHGIMSWYGCHLSRTHGTPDLTVDWNHYLSCIEKRKQELISSFHCAAKKVQLEISNEVKKPVQKKAEMSHPQDSSKSDLPCANSLEMAILHHRISASSTASLSSCLNELETIGDIRWWDYEPLEELSLHQLDNARCINSIM